MASESEASCDADPNFAVICSFLDKFGQACGLHTVDLLDLQEMLENTQEVSPILIDLHVKLLRKMRRSVNPDRWERSVVKICHSYSNQDAWEIERFGYKKSRLSVKLRLLKTLLEMQFDGNPSFKNKINVVTAKELRSQPLGRDKLGNAYWYQADDNCQIRVYKEDLDEETWALVAKDREGLVTLISKLSDNHDSSSTDAATNEDSNSVEIKPTLDTGQQDSSSSNGKKSQSDEDKTEALSKEEVDDEDTKMEGKADGKCGAQVMLMEEKKPELSGIKEKYIRSDNFVQSNRKAVESAGFVDVDVGHVELKRPSLEDIEDLSLVKRPRTDRPSLLGDKKKPYLRDAREDFDEDSDAEDEDSDDDEEEEEDEEDEEEDDEQTDDESDHESPVGDEIQEPLMLVMGKGTGQENNCGNVIVGEEIVEEVVYFYGEGSGCENETGKGDNGKKDSEHNAERKEGETSESSITSTTKNNFKLGMILDSKIDHSTTNEAKVQAKRSLSRWDVGRPENACNSNVSCNRNAESGAEEVGKRAVCDSGAVSVDSKANSGDAAAIKKPSFFFGPSSGFAFKTPSPIVKPPVINFGFGAAAMQKPKSVATSICSPNTTNTIANQPVTVNVNSSFSNSEEKRDNEVPPQLSNQNEEEIDNATTYTEKSLGLEDKELLSSSVTEDPNRSESEKQIHNESAEIRSESVTIPPSLEESTENQNEVAKESCTLKKCDDEQTEKQQTPNTNVLGIEQGTINENPEIQETKSKLFSVENLLKERVDKKERVTVAQVINTHLDSNSDQITETLDSVPEKPYDLIPTPTQLSETNDNKEPTEISPDKVDGNVAEEVPTTLLTSEEPQGQVIEEINPTTSSDLPSSLVSHQCADVAPLETVQNDNSSIPTKETESQLIPTETTAPNETLPNEDKYEEHGNDVLPEKSPQTVPSDVVTVEGVNEAPITINKDVVSEVPTDSSVQDMRQVSSPSQKPDIRLDDEAHERNEESTTIHCERSELPENVSAPPYHATIPQPDIATSLETPQCQVLEKEMPELQPIDEPVVPSHDYKLTPPDVPLASLLQSTGRIAESMHMFSAHTALMDGRDQSQLLEVVPLIKDSLYISQMNPALGCSDLMDLTKMPPVLTPETPIADPVVIQEIGSLTMLQPMNTTLSECVPEMEKQIVPYEVAADLSHSYPVLVPVNVPTTVLPQPFNEIPCEKRTAALLTESVEHSSDGDMNFDDNASEPMDLEETKSSHIIEHSHDDIRRIDEEPIKSEMREEKKASLQSLSLDFTGEAPDLSEVQALVNRCKKQEEEDEVEEAGERRQKIRGKRVVDKNLRKTIEDAKNQNVSSSDEDTNKPKIAQDEPKVEKKPKAKRKKLLLGLEIPDDGVFLDQPTGLRQSRRIAQLKIKEEAERRKLEEIALEEMKNSQKRKSKKDEDKDYKAEKRKRIKTLSDDESSNDAEADDKKKKKKKRKHRKFDEHNPWRSSSEDSSTEDTHVEEEEEEEDHYVEIFKSDHEFSPESDLENAQDTEPLKRARTVKKEDQEEEEDDYDDTNCQKCNKSDHPEWILLCDGCDAGWHCSCLRPALLVIPEGDWYCPPCQHTSLIKLLQEKLVEFDKIQTKREMEIRRKERLAYVGISLDNVLPAKDEDSQKTKRQKHRRIIQEVVSGDDSSSGSESQKSESDSASDSESGSSSSSPDSDEPIYKLRQRRQAQSYRFKDYDELIKSAVQEEVDEMQQTHDYQSKGKDMSTIVQAEGIPEEPIPPPIEQDESEEDVIRPVKKIIGKKKHRKLNSLDISSEEDEDSDEDFKGSTGDEDEDEEYDEYNDYGSSSSSSSLVGKRRKGKGVRRSTRARTSRYDAEFINDESEDSDEPRRKRNRSDWEESDESEEESEKSWRNRKKRSKKRLPTGSVQEKKKSKKNKNRDDSDPDVYRRKKPKNKFGAFDDVDTGRRRTRGKKINYLDALGTDSEEESRRRNQVKEEESEDEFVLNEEEDDAQYEAGREVDDSDDSTTGRLVPGVKKGSKKGKGKGGIKRIKRAQGEEEEALFPPLTSAPPTEEALPDNEPNPIEQINKNLEAMDEKEIGMMMEEEEYANKQLQMVAAQLEKEKRRKELEARKQEIAQQQAQPPDVLQPSAVPSVIQALPVTMPQMMSQMRPLHPEQLQPIHHDIPHTMHQNLPPMYHQSPQHIHQQSPQHMTHMPPVSQSPMMLAEAGTPKKRGRKPKTALGTPEMQFMPSTPSDKSVSDDSDMYPAFNADGTPKRRRGRGKGKKTLEKEAAAAAAASGPPSSPPSRPEDAKDLPERKAPTPDIPPMTGGKLGVAAAPQPFSQNQPKPSVITRMLQAQPGQPAYPVGSHTFPERPIGPGSQPPFMGGPNPILPGVPPRVLHPGTFRPGLNHYPVIRSGAPPIRPPNVAPHVYHHPLDTTPGGVSLVTTAERSSPAHSSPSSVSPLSNKSDQTPPPPPPQYIVRPPLVRFPLTSAAPGMPRHPQLLSQLHPARLAYPGAPPPQHPNYHYTPSYSEGGGVPQGPASANVSFHVPPTQYQEQFAGGSAESGRNYDEENGEFGGLVSYFSSQREDDLDA